MENRKIRRKIIDTTSVQRCRRTDRSDLKPKTKPNHEKNVIPITFVTELESKFKQIREKSIERCIDNRITDTNKNNLEETIKHETKRVTKEEKENVRKVTGVKLADANDTQNQKFDTNEICAPETKSSLITVCLKTKTDVTPDVNEDDTTPVVNSTVFNLMKGGKFISKESQVNKDKVFALRRTEGRCLFQPETKDMPSISKVVHQTSSDESGIVTESNLVYVKEGNDVIYTQLKKQKQCELNKVSNKRNHDFNDYDNCVFNNEICDKNGDILGLFRNRRKTWQHEKGLIDSGNFNINNPFEKYNTKISEHETFSRLEPDLVGREGLLKPDVMETTPGLERDITDASERPETGVIKTSTTFQHETAIMETSPQLEPGVRKKSLRFEDEPNLAEIFPCSESRVNVAQKTRASVSLINPLLELKDPFSIELEKTSSAALDGTDDGAWRENVSDLFADIYREYRRESLESPIMDLDHIEEEGWIESCVETFGYKGYGHRVDLTLYGSIMSLIIHDISNSNILEAYTGMTDGHSGNPRLLSVEEKWQIIFNERTRAPIYAVAQYVAYLNQFVNGLNGTSRDKHDVTKKDGINPMSYMLRKLKLDLKMSYDSFIDEFLKPENNGMGLLIKLLKTIQDTGTQQSGSTNRSQLKNYKKTLTDEHDCLLCIKFALRVKTALQTLLDITYGLETVAMSILSTFTKSRGTAIEILTLSLSASEGFSRTLDCFTVLRLKIGEPVRFKSLMNMMNLDSQQNIIFKVSCMKFLNSLLEAASNLNKRVYVQHEIESAGLNVKELVEKTNGTGLEYDELRHELSEWNRKYVNVDTIVSQRSNVAMNHDSRFIIENLEKQVQILNLEKSNLERKLKAVSLELGSSCEELKRRTLLTHNASVQTTAPAQSSSRDVGCQCKQQLDTYTDSDTPLRNAAKFFGWQDSKERDTVYYVDYRNGTDHHDDHDVTDDEGVEKVQQWLHSHCGDSDSSLDILPNCVTEKDLPAQNNHQFRRQYSIRSRCHASKTEFPGNWKIMPKSIEQFPARFSSHQCHATNCDRCDLRNRSENLKSGHVVMQNKMFEFRPNPVFQNDKLRQTLEVKSHSSDSAIGGSGERLWSSSKDRRIQLLPAEVSEAEILQELIQPDDSASGCPMSEPYPDYSVVGNKFNTQRSYKAELSEILRDFEGSLKTYESNATEII